MTQATTNNLNLTGATFDKLKCKECGEEHGTNEVEILNICESMYGEDLVQFLCPHSQHVTEALVYGK